MNKLICRGNLIFLLFSAFSLFDKVSFRQGGFSAKWLFGEVVFGKVLCIGIFFFLIILKQIVGTH